MQGSNAIPAGVQQTTRVVIKTVVNASNRVSCRSSESMRTARLRQKGNKLAVVTKPSVPYERPHLYQVKLEARASKAAMGAACT